MDLIISSARQVHETSKSGCHLKLPQERFFIYLCYGALFNNQIKVRRFFPWFKFHECLFALSLIDNQINLQVKVLINKYGSLCEMN